MLYFPESKLKFMLMSVHLLNMRSFLSTRTPVETESAKVTKGVAELWVRPRILQLFHLTDFWSKRLQVFCRAVLKQFAKLTGLQLYKLLRCRYFLVKFVNIFQNTLFYRTSQVGFFWDIAVFLNIAKRFYFATDVISKPWLDVIKQQRRH